MSCLTTACERKNKENKVLSSESSLNCNVDLFAIIGSARNFPDGALDKFIEAYAEDPKTALRILLWARDARGGAGKRNLFRAIMSWLAKNDKRAVTSIMLSGKIPELGRFDDYVPLLCNEEIPRQIRFHLAEQLKIALETKADSAGLIAKWMPRKGKEAAIIRNLMGLSPKAYRKLLVEHTNVVENKMCAKDWKSIDFNNVPSIAMARYTNAFKRNAPKNFNAYKQSLANGEVKAKAGALENATDTSTCLRPTNMKSILRADHNTLESIMKVAIGSKRYDIEGLTV